MPKYFTYDHISWYLTRYIVISWRLYEFIKLNGWSSWIILIYEYNRDIIVFSRWDANKKELKSFLMETTLILHIILFGLQCWKSSPDMVNNSWYLFKNFIWINFWLSQMDDLMRALIIFLSSYRDHFYWHGLSLISAWISNHMPDKVWDEITYPFSNFNCAAVEVWEWISNFTPHFTMDLITYPC